jgi:membrane protease YdiL (CAAX protease family)
LKRAAEFLRSVIPADPAQLLFLVGIVCLVIAPHLRWWPAGVPISPEHLTEWLGRQAQTIGIFLLFPIMFASVAGYFVCFWPGNRPTRRVFCAVCLPAIGSFSLMLGRLLYLTGPRSSVFETTAKAAHAVNWVESLWKLPPGFHVCLIGVLLVLTFTSRLSFAITTLPLALPEGSVLRPENGESWRRTQVLIWVLVGPLFLLYSLLAWLIFGIPILLLSRSTGYLQNVWFSRGITIVEVLPLGFALWLAGDAERRILRGLIRLPQYVYFFVALAFPIGICAAISAGQYFFDRAAWAAHDFGRLDPPQLASYFALPDPWLLLLFFAAFFEELIFRGVLQRRFLERYGLYRGIFLVGIVWAAFHFFSDFSFSRLSDLSVLFLLCSRVSFSVAHTFVFGWLTLRSRSILPAALAHTFHNVLVHTQFGPNFPGKDALRIALWGLLAVVLFRYWPVGAEGESASDVAMTAPEAAG